MEGANRQENRGPKQNDLNRRDAQPVQPKKQRGPGRVQSELHNKKRERHALNREPAPLPNHPGRNRHQRIKRRPYRSEDPRGRIPGRFREGRIPFPWPKEPAHSCRAETKRKPPNQTQPDSR